MQLLPSRLLSLIKACLRYRREEFHSHLRPKRKEVRGVLFYFSFWLSAHVVRRQNLCETLEQLLLSRLLSLIKACLGYGREEIHSHLRPKRREVRGVLFYFSFWVSTHVVRRKDLSETLVQLLLSIASFN